MRTNEEILARVKEIENDDIFGFESNDLIGRLPAELAAPFFKEDVSKVWEEHPRDRESLLAEMLEYMPFAWEKANNFRGLSANRSMNHYSAWVWLAGDDLGNLNEFENYGKDNLVRICEHYGWDHKQWDDGVRLNSEP